MIEMKGTIKREEENESVKEKFKKICGKRR